MFVKIKELESTYSPFGVKLKLVSVVCVKTRLVYIYRLNFLEFSSESFRDLSSENK